LLPALAAVTAGLAAVAWFLPLYFDQRAAAIYEVRLEETRTAALQAESLKKRLTMAMDLNRFVIDRRAAIPTITSLLADVTDRLPDDAWLIQFQLQDGKLTLAGYAPSAAPLIALLEASPLLTEVRFASPVTPDPRTGGENFNISASVTQDRGS
jgi:general secretion pathway protein L